MNRPTLSVIIPNFNHAQYLPRCLEAVLKQSVQPMEILIMDDASTDNSVEIIDSYAKRFPIIRLHRNQRNLGVVANINLGIDLARADYVFSAAADDEIVAGFFEKSLELLAGHPEAALCCTIGDYRESHTGLNWHWGVGMADRPAYLSPARMMELEWKDRFYIPPHSVIFRKQALVETGRYRPELKYVCDWFAMYAAGFRYGICFVPEPLAVFHIQPDSYYQRGRRDRIAHQKVIHDLLDLLTSAEFRDVAERIRESGSLFLFGWPVLNLMLRDPSCRRFITPGFLRKNLWHTIKLALKKITPRFAAEWYFQLAGYKTRT